MRKQILHTLLAAAVSGLFAVGCLSCGSSHDGGFENFSADTLSLFEGRRLYGEGEYELAREQLMKSVGSTSTYIRAESYLYLNALEMDLGNWDAARPWLEKYHAEAMKLFRQALDAGERITIHEERTERSISSLRWLVAGVVCVVSAIAGLAVWERRRVGTPTADLATRDVVERGEWEGWRAGAEAFMRTAVYAEIAELERQPADRRARVLSLSRQEALDAELADHFAEFAGLLCEVCPALTAGDVKLCCLSLTPLSTFGRALCFGSTETNIIKQRKHKIKRKLTTDDGRQLFDFIFAPRDQMPHL
jgi:succinate dehydrogenase/fumarate reductase flavoprotein subunit